MYVTLFHLQIRKVLLNQLHLVSEDLLIFVCLILGNCHNNTVQCQLFNQYCCSLCGSPLWSLKSTIVEYMCVDWRRALRSLWRVDHRTHCELITSASNLIPLILSLICLL